MSTTAQEIAGALGVSKRAVELRALRESWPYHELACRGGRKRVYPADALPAPVRAALAARQGSAPAVSAPAGAGSPPASAAAEPTPALSALSALSSLAGTSSPADAGDRPAVPPGGAPQGAAAEVFSSPTPGPDGAGQPGGASTAHPRGQSTALVTVNPRAAAPGRAPGKARATGTAPGQAPGQVPAPATAPVPADDAALAAAVQVGLLVDANDAEARARLQVAITRERIIRPLAALPERLPGRRALAERLAQAHATSVPTLYRWERAYRRGGLAALMDRPRGDRGQARYLISQAWEQAASGAGLDAAARLAITATLRREVRGLWAQQGISSWRQVALLGATALYRHSVAAGMPADLARAVCQALPRRFCDAERRFQLIAVHDRDAKGFYDRTCAVKRSRADLQPGDIVYGDVSPCDIPLLRDDGTTGWGRLIAWQDAATNWIHVTGYLARPGAGVRREHVALSFAAMCAEAPFGMPKRLYLDNGAEFSWTEMLDAWAELVQFTNGAFGGTWDAAALGADDRVTRSLPFRPRAKAIEGQFSNLLKLMSWHPGFAGSDRLRKKTASLGRGLQPAPLADARDFLAQAMACYHGIPQSGHLGGQSPAEAMAAFQAAGFTPLQPNPEALALAFADRLERIARAGQVEAGGWRYYHPDLYAYDEQKLLVRFPRHAPDVCFCFHQGQLVAAALPVPVFRHQDPAGAEHAGRLAAEARRAVRVMKGLVSWLDPRDLMGEFAALAGVEQVVEQAAARARRVEFSDEVKALLAGRQRAAQAALEQAALSRAPATLVANRYGIRDEEAEAARAWLGTG